MLRYNFLKLTWVVVAIMSHVHEMRKMHDLRYKIAEGLGRCEFICLHACRNTIYIDGQLNHLLLNLKNPSNYASYNPPVILVVIVLPVRLKNL